MRYGPSCPGISPPYPHAIRLRTQMSLKATTGSPCVTLKNQNGLKSYYRVFRDHMLPFCLILNTHCHLSFVTVTFPTQCLFQYPAFIHICLLVCVHSWRVWVAKQETLTPPGHWLKIGAIFIYKQRTCHKFFTH